MTQSVRISRRERAPSFALDHAIDRISRWLPALGNMAAFICFTYLAWFFHSLIASDPDEHFMHGPLWGFVFVHSLLSVVYAWQSAKYLFKAKMESRHDS